MKGADIGMKISNPFSDIIVFESDIFTDDRGMFYEAFRKEHLEKMSIQNDFCQDNVSISRKYVVRGLHIQKYPYEQGKLVRVLSGSVFDVVVDARLNSDHFGKFYSLTMTAKSGTSLYIPPGFAHGFCALEDDTILYYKCTEYYSPDNQISINPLDQALSINWPYDSHDLIMSSKDGDGITWHEYIGLL